MADGNIYNREDITNGKILKQLLIVFGGQELWKELPKEVTCYLHAFNTLLPLQHIFIDSRDTHLAGFDIIV